MPEYHWNIIEKLKEHKLDFHPQKCCHIQLTVTVSPFHKYVKKTLKSVLAVLKKCFFFEKNNCCIIKNVHAKFQVRHSYIYKDNDDFLFQPLFTSKKRLQIRYRFKALCQTTWLLGVAKKMTRNSVITVKG